MTIENNWICDGPACTEETTTPQDWITMATLNEASQTPTQSIIDRFDDTAFHNETCMQAYLDA